MTQTTFTYTDAVVLMLQRCDSIDDTERDALVGAVLGERVTPELEERLAALFDHEATLRDDEAAAVRSSIMQWQAVADEARIQAGPLAEERARMRYKAMDDAATGFQSLCAGAERDVDATVETAARSGEQSEMDALRAMLQQKKD